MTRIDVIKQFIVSEALKDGEGVRLGEKDDLIGSGILDSLGIMKLLTFLEETFHIVLKEDELIPESFESVEAILSLVNRKTSSGEE